MDREGNKRVTKRFKKPNALFEQWLLEWRAEDESKGSNRAKCFDKALNSLKKYPLPLLTGKDCLILQGFGKTLCAMIDNRLRETCEGCADDLIEEVRDIAEKKEYKPVLGSGPYAILNVLRSSDGLTKDIIIKKAAVYYEKDSSDGAVWSGISALAARNLITKSGNPSIYKLTEAGIRIASKLNVPVGDVEAEAQAQAEAQARAEAEAFLTSNSFEIVLLIDTQETCGSKNVQIDETIRLFETSKIRFEVRHLKIGDYVWIARHPTSRTELLLPYVIERKRIDDFASSIKDGRFHEQKFRLKKSGVPNLIYLIENNKEYGKSVGLPLTTLHQAAINTLVQDSFGIKYTNGLKETVDYISTFSRILWNIYKSKTLMTCPKSDLTNGSLEDDLIPLMRFDEFNQTSSKNKNFRVKEMFIKQLLCLKGLSVDKALAIIDVYPSPRSLKRKYQSSSEGISENLLAEIRFGKAKKKIGPAVSKSVYQLFTMKSY